MRTLRKTITRLGNSLFKQLANLEICMESKLESSSFITLESTTPFIGYFNIVIHHTFSEVKVLISQVLVIDVSVEFSL